MAPKNVLHSSKVAENKDLVSTLAWLFLLCFLGTMLVSLFCVKLFDILSATKLCTKVNTNFFDGKKDIFANK